MDEVLKIALTQPLPVSPPAVAPEAAEAAEVGDDAITH
jgi:hypothetical protein